MVNNIAGVGSNPGSGRKLKKQKKGGAYISLTTMSETGEPALSLATQLRRSHSLPGQSSRYPPALTRNRIRARSFPDYAPTPCLVTLARTLKLTGLLSERATSQQMFHSYAREPLTHAAAAGQADKLDKLDKEAHTIF